MVVDATTVILENVDHHMKGGMLPFDAAQKGTEEVAFSVLGGALTTIGVFAPVAFMGGIIGRCFFHFGITVVITGLIQGLGTELGFACFKWKKWGFLSLSVASVLSGIFIYIYELFYLQYYMLDPMMHVGHLVIRSISAIIFSGILCKLIGDGLAKTGVMKNYAIGRTLKSSGVYEDEE
jgi:ABC-type thiamin/hydroxymethylpyrimidine transport system permease subunit